MSVCHRKLSEAEIKILLKDIVILIDTRENKCQHIIDFLDEKGIKWEKRKLLSGDYSCYFPENTKVGTQEMTCEMFFAIERKANLNEICNNLAKGRERFIREFERYDGTLTIVLEQDSYTDLVTHNYRSMMNPLALNNSIMSLKAKYNADTHFLGDRRLKISAFYIVSLIIAQAKEFLRGVG